MRLTSFFLIASSLSLFACSSGSSNDGSGNGALGGAGGAATKFFLPTGDPTNTSAPSLAIDADDGVHMVYPEYVQGGAYYAYCGPSCTKPEDVQTLRIPTDGTVHNAMIALDAQGHPRVLLSTMQRVMYGECDADCTNEASWKGTVVLEHGGDREVTGKAFALDPNGRPRFVMHTYKAYLGIGQKTPETLFVSCDTGCGASGSAWTTSKISSQMWRGSTLAYDASGRAHLATVANVDRTESSSGKEMGAYVLCESACDTEDGWVGTALMPAFESELDAIAVKPAISLALTKSGAPRVLLMGMFEDTMKRNLTYFECDAECTTTGWTGSIISDHEKVGAGLELVLDSKDKPRFVYTLDYNIVLASCDDASCAQADSTWGLTKVEYGGEMKPDEIFLYTNCTVGAWFLHSPSVVLTKSDRPRVGYQARDISGGWNNPDPATKADCRAGTDMTWSRFALL